MSTVRQRIVILGAGIGGISAYRRFHALGVTRRARIVLVNRENHFLFIPFLHEVATGGLAASNAVVALRDIVGDDDTRIVRADATGIDADRRVVHTTAGDIGYDHLLIATGSEPDFRGIPGAQEHALPLRNLSDARRIRAAFIGSFERAASETVAGKPPCILEFVIVGGGPTGVELAGEVADLFTHTLRRYFRRHLDRWHFRVTLVQSAGALLPALHPSLQERALRTLTDRGVRVLLNRNVAGIQKTGVQLADGTILPACHVIWAAGAKPSVPPSTPAFPRQPNGRILVDEMLRVPGTRNVWAVGDAAAALERDGSFTPMRAQEAVREGRRAAENIAATVAGRPSKAFRYRHKGNVVSLGRWRALADIRGLRWSGRFAWWLKRTVYLMNIPSGAQRVRIAVDWTMNLLRPRDISGV